MYDCQQSLIIHIGRQFTAPQLKTLRAYAGELRDANKLTQLTPAALVAYSDGSPLAQNGEHVFNLLIVNDSQVFDQLTNQNNNLQLAAQIANYLRQQNIFNRQGGDGTYEIAVERATADAFTLKNSDRFIVINLTLPIKDHTR